MWPYSKILNFLEFRDTTYSNYDIKLRFYYPPPHTSVKTLLDSRKKKSSARDGADNK